MYAYNAEDSRSGDRSHSRGSGEPQNPPKVASVIVPDYSLGAHVAALGLDFSTPAMGPEFVDGAFVGEQW